METEKRGLLVKDIEEMKSGELEQMFLISYYSLSSYFKSLLAFGHKSAVTRDNLKIIKEMFNIICTERQMLNFILANIDTFDIDTATEIVGMMDEVNDRTIAYYYDVINDIEDACELGEERRGKRPRRNFSTINQTDFFANEIMAMAESKESIKSFLGFEDAFLEFIKDKDDSTLRISGDIAVKTAYVTPIHDENGNVVDFKMLIPEVVNLETALKAISLYSKAYDLYRSIKYSVVKDTSIDCDSTQDRYKEYLFDKSRQLLQLKM